MISVPLGTAYHWKSFVDSDSEADEGNFNKEKNKEICTTNVDIVTPNLPTSDGIIVCSSFELCGETVEGFLTTKKLCWCGLASDRAKKKSSRASTHSILISEVFAVRYEQKGDTTNSHDHDFELYPSRHFGVHFVKRVKGSKWKEHSLTFTCSDSQTCKKWVDGIQMLLDALDRPRSLLVFINPVGGKKLGQKIYREKVGPLFDVAKILQNVIVTERSNHAKDYLMSEDLSCYDGVVFVGGDGMFSEVLNGVLKRNDADREKGEKDSRKLTIGIIPAGSTDTVVYCTSGSNDPSSSALRIIMGDKLPLDVCSVRHQGQLLKYSVSLMGYGYFGDLARESEALRWMGPKRYDFAGFKKFMGNKSYSGQVSYIKSRPQDEVDGWRKTRCKAGCKQCARPASSVDGTISPPQWETIRGRFISVLGVNITCRCARSSTGMSPHAHLGDGYMDLILVKRTSRAKYLQHLIKIADKSLNQFNFNFIEVHRVKEMKFSPVIEDITTSPDRRSISSTATSLSTSSSNSNDVSVWNVDGEVVETPDIHIKVHRQLVNVYGRGIEDVDETPSIFRSCTQPEVDD